MTALVHSPDQFDSDSVRHPEPVANHLHAQNTTPALQQQKSPHAMGSRRREATPPPRLAPPRTRPTQHGNKAAAFSAGTLRAGFLRKVYGLLAAQMLVTVGISFACMRVPTIRDAFVNLAFSGNQMLYVAMFVPTFLSLLILQLGAKTSYPANYILLLVFTLGESFNVGFVCAIYDAAGMGVLIVTAFAITAGLFAILTAYALISGKDFSYLGGFLTTALFGLVAAGLIGVIFPGLGSNIVVSVIGALTFCAYILFDTWRIEKKFDYDDYICATIELYLDIINLFLYILKILRKLQNNSKTKGK